MLGSGPDVWSQAGDVEEDGRRSAAITGAWFQKTRMAYLDEVPGGPDDDEDRYISSDSDSNSGSGSDGEQGRRGRPGRKARMRGDHAR